MSDLKERLRANGLDECDEAIARIETLEKDLKAVLRREEDANRAAMKHLRALEQERIKSKNYADFSHEWRKRCEALEKAVKELLPQNLGLLPLGYPDSATVPVDMTFGEIRRARAAIARAKGEA